MTGQLNAYTSREQTAYYARVLPKDLSQGIVVRNLLYNVHARIIISAVDILSDMVQNSTLDEKEMEKERDIILKDVEVSYHLCL